ncbi:hypothetical protein K474DRAFT_1656879 [Panus rudis PR-1116 ss-1]|nr:hypothetical protein K474DRAFT_1656879 [Panus rudis PR-1116 ss-1]
MSAPSSSSANIVHEPTPHNTKPKTSRTKTRRRHDGRSYRELLNKDPRLSTDPPGVFNEDEGITLWGFGYICTTRWLYLWAKQNDYPLTDLVPAMNAIQCHVGQPELPTVTAPLDFVLCTMRDQDECDAGGDKYVRGVPFFCAGMNRTQAEIDEAAPLGDELKQYLSRGMPEGYTPDDEALEPIWFRIWRS